MGYSTPPDDAPRTETPPLTRERVEAFLASQGWHYTVDSDGDVGGNWDDNIFYFLLIGASQEILQVRGRWKRSLPAAAEHDFLRLANEYNRDRVWPKVYCRAEDGEIGIYAEVSTSLESGVTDDQLRQLMTCGLVTGLQFFGHLDEWSGSSADDDPGRGR